MFDWSPGEVLRIADLVRERGRLLQRLAEIDEVLHRDLPARLTAIAVTSRKPLKLIDFVAQARQAGFRTNAKSGVSGMTYHGVKLLVKHGVLKWDEEGQGYVFAGIGPSSSDE